MTFNGGNVGGYNALSARFRLSCLCWRMNAGRRGRDGFELWKGSVETGEIGSEGVATREGRRISVNIWQWKRDLKKSLGRYTRDGGNV